MKKLASLCLILTAAYSISLAQESIVAQINYNQLEKYIEAAQKNYPRKQILAQNTEAARANVPMAQVSYLDIFNGTYIYRPDEATAINTLNPYVVNGFQFGVSVNVGTFLQKPFQVKKAKAELKAAQLEEKEYEGVLANEVKTRYYNYIYQLNELKLKTQSAQDIKTVSEDLRNKFEKGEITIQGYNQARVNANDSNSEKIQAELEFLKAKDSLEQIIGQKLEEIN